MANTQNKTIKKLLMLLASLFLALVFGSVIGDISGRYIKMLRLQYELNQARIQWASKKPPKYQVTIYSRNFFDSNLTSCLSGGVTIVINNGVIVNGNYPDKCKPVYDEITVEKMFDRVEGEVTSLDMLVTNQRVMFDPELGFVSYYYVQRSDAIFSSSFHEKWLDFEEFTILDK